jgi:ribosome-binding protein aMBF1 (putative translation factor)
MADKFETEVKYLRGGKVTDAQAKQQGRLVTLDKFKSDSTGVNKAKLANDEDYTFATVTAELAKQIQQARAEKKMTRKDLAMKMGVKETDLAKYETYDPNHKIPVDSGFLRKLNTQLGTSFKKAKAKKQTPEK